MEESYIEISWPNGETTFNLYGLSWLEAAQKANMKIPTGCLNGSCGACEIEVNGEIVRACISNIPGNLNRCLTVEFTTDEFW